MVIGPKKEFVEGFEVIAIFHFLEILKNVSFLHAIISKTL